MAAAGTYRTQVLVIGGGVTGTSLLRDLALRGVDCLLVEQEDIDFGASGRNHGLLHSGARYVAGDIQAASECRAEGAILKRIAPHAIEDTGGLFVAVKGDDENYISDFASLCARAGISASALEIGEARRLEPGLSEKLIAAYSVPDAAIDPFRLALDCVAQAQSLGARVLRHARVTGFERSGRRILAARSSFAGNGDEIHIECEQVLNAAGAWARELARLAGAELNLSYSKGTLLVTHGRIAHRVINRLRKPGNADIVMPGGTVSIAGTTSTPIESLEHVRPSPDEADLIVENAAQMLPALEQMRYIRAYSGVRPLIGTAGAADARKLSRGFALYDHLDQGLDNFATITGGKLTTCRLMAERAADLACARLKVASPCVTASTPLPAAASSAWTEPGRAARAWLEPHPANETLLCECELLGSRAIDAICAALSRYGEAVSLRDLGLRSRLGKGACQGAFCGARVLAHLYQAGGYERSRGQEDLRVFLRERWRGQRAVLWGEQLAQAELSEALHCGLFGEEREEGQRVPPLPGDADSLA